MLKESQGTIIKLYPLGEQGLIVVWLTRDFGIIRTAARNARKGGSDFFGQLDLFYESNLCFQEAKRGDLHTLKSVELQHARLHLRKSLQGLQLASYMTRLILATVEEGHEEASWHQLLSGGLDYLNEQGASLSIMRHFEKRLADLHGLYVLGKDAYSALQSHFTHMPAGREALCESLTSP